MVSKRQHPKFRRPNYGRSSRSRIKLAWRRPRGIDNKKRLKIAYMGCSPSIGYGQPAEIKHHHPQGMPEALVQSPFDLHGLKGVVIRIASGVGAVKREAIQKLAETMKLRVLNPRKFVPKVPKPKGKKDEKRQEAKKDEQKATQAQGAPSANQSEAKKEEPKPVEAKKEEKPAQSQAPPTKAAEKPPAAPPKQ